MASGPNEILNKRLSQKGEDLIRELPSYMPSVKPNAEVLLRDTPEDEARWERMFRGAHVVGIFVSKEELDYVENKMIPSQGSISTEEIEKRIIDAYMNRDIPMIGVQLADKAKAFIDQNTRGGKIWFGAHAIIFPRIYPGDIRLALVEEGYLEGSSIEKYIQKSTLKLV